MKKTISYIICALSLVACGDDGDLVLPNTQDVVPLAGIDAEVYSGASTRAPALDKDNHVGRSVFVNADQMVLTSIKRTSNPVNKFSYKGIVYGYSVEQGQTYGSWNRDVDKGGTEADPNTVPLRIYWSDAASKHTYIGYSLPQPFDGFTWNEDKDRGTYTGQLRSVSSQVSEESSTSFIDHTTGDKIKTDDLLLTYDNGKLAETGGSVAKLYFYHALANVRVIVNISGFSANDQLDDVKSHVHDMVLEDMPIDYQWDQNSAGVTALSDSRKMDTHMWIPRQDGTGTGVGKQFTFYALAVPRTEVSQAISFKVTYPDPMKPDKKTLTNTYTTEISGIEYRAGFCTTINITLNHQNEDITVGAEYMDWQYVETPDQSELKKNSTMLTSKMLDRSNYTLFGDVKANADDATWLYIDESSCKIVDIYGNDGSLTNPFVIATAQQLVAFANEVKGTDRSAVTYKNLEGTETPLAAGASFDFTDYYVKLDADIVLQPELMPTAPVTWCGIGDDAHAFNGKFLGGKRTIRSLYGSPLFYKLGPKAVVEQLNIMDVIEVDGRGTIANESSGLIAAVFANGPIRQKEPEDKAIYSGSLVGTVATGGAVISCAHFGDVEAWAEGEGVIGGLVGYNQGLLLACYHSGKEKNLVNNAGPANTYAGVGKFSEEGSYAFSCYYNIDADPEKSDYASLTHGKHAFPVHIDVMQSDKFVKGTDAIDVLKDDNSNYDLAHQEWTNQHMSLNNALDIFKQHADDNTIPESIRNESHRTWFKDNYPSYQFTYTPGEYPRVQ